MLRFLFLFLFVKYDIMMIKYLYIELSNTVISLSSLNTFANADVMFSYRIKINDPHEQ